MKPETRLCGNYTKIARSGWPPGAAKQGPAKFPPSWRWPGDRQEGQAELLGVSMRPATSSHCSLGPGAPQLGFPGLLTRVPLCTSAPTVPSDCLARPSPSDMPSWLRSAESNPTPGDPVSFLQLRGTRERPASLSNMSFVVTPIFDTHVPGHLLKGQSVSSMPHARHPTCDGAAAELPSWASAERRSGSQRDDCDRLGGGGQHLSVPVTPARCQQRAQVCLSLRPGRRGTEGSRGEGGAYPRSTPAG